MYNAVSVCTCMCQAFALLFITAPQRRQKQIKPQLSLLSPPLPDIAHMAQAAEHGSAAQPASRLTFQEAQVAARESKAPPGRAKANKVLKACREQLQNCCGAYVDLKAELMFHPQAYLGKHPDSRSIFRADVVGFLFEVFPEKEPNASKLSDLNLCVDFVCLRADGTAVWLHPSKAAEATVSQGSLESWRSGASPVFRLDPDAIKEQRRQLGVTVAAVGAEVEPAESQGATSHMQLAMLD